MGKKIAKQASSKSSNKNHEKKQLNSLIRILKPKVYITDTSSFKSLVQQLTGNEGTRSSWSFSPVTNPNMPAAEAEQVVVLPSVFCINSDEDDYHGDLEIITSINEINSSDASIDSSLELCNNQVMINCIPEELQQFTFEELMSLEDDQRRSEAEDFVLNMNEDQDVDYYSLVYQDVESWLLEVEPYATWCV